MKKLISLLVAMLCVCSLGCPVFANDTQDTTPVDGNEITVISEKTPEEILAEGKGSVPNFEPRPEITKQIRGNFPLPSSVLKISGGKAYFSSTVDEYPSATKIRVATYLQEFRNNNWYDLTSFANTSYGTTVTASGSYTVQPGKRYRAVGYVTYTVGGSSTTLGGPASEDSVA